MPDQLENVIAYYTIKSESYIDSYDPENFHWGLYRRWANPFFRLFPHAALTMRAAPLRRVNRLLFSQAPLNADSRVLEVGCGHGGFSRLLATTFGCTITAMDLTPACVEMSKKKTANLPIADRITFVQGNASIALPMENNSVDAVFSIDSACYYQDRPRFISEVFRVLKPGGTFVIEDWLARDGLDESGFKKYVQPVCDTWSCAGMESLGSYVNLISKTGLEVFNKKDLHPWILPIGYLFGLGAKRMEKRAEANIRVRQDRLRYIALSSALLQGALTTGFVASRKPL